MTIRGPQQTAIIGAGPAGLAAGYYARRANLGATLFEAGPEAGGNARTLRHGEFLFDTGAHRFHGHDPLVTRDVQKLMGDELRRIDVPSQIMYGKRFIDFPLSPLNLLGNFGVGNLVRATIDYGRARVSGSEGEASFESVALSRYGRTIADAFLLAYTEKLWGLPADQLSPMVSGKRLKGLNLKTFVIESFLGSRSKTEHLDGTFFYPRRGIGRIMERLADECGRDRIRLDARVTKLLHESQRITGIELQSGERVSLDCLISTLPLSLNVSLLDPPAPEDLLRLTKRIRFRNVVLVVLFLDRESVTPNASLYFPDPDVPFTRAYEPRNRSVEMSPAGRTSLAVEIPCSRDDGCWTDSDESLIRMCLEPLVDRGLIRREEVIEGRTHRLASAYPVLEMGFEKTVTRLFDYLDGFSNLWLTGRNARFAYTHIHDLMKSGRETVEEILKSAPQTVSA